MNLVNTETEEACVNYYRALGKLVTSDELSPEALAVFNAGKRIHERNMQPVMNIIIPYDDYECTLPPGLRIKVYFEDGGHSDINSHDNVPWMWDRDDDKTPTVARFEILGVSEGW